MTAMAGPGQAMRGDAMESKVKIDQDLHIHTYLSSCCKEKEKQRPAQILSLAGQMGVRIIGFADHMWLNPGLSPSQWYSRQDESQLTRLRADLANISTEVHALVGCEAETVAPGKFGITHQHARALDFVLLSCSHFHMKDFVAQPESDSPRHLANHMLDFFRSAVTSGLPTSIAHPLFPFGYFDLFDAAIESISDSEFMDVFSQAGEHKVALEITVAFKPSKSNARFSMETPVRFLSIARQAGCKFTLGSDSHSPSSQKRLPELAPLLQAIGIEDEDIWRPKPSGH